MSTITAPPAPSPPFYIGKGMRDANNTQQYVFGYTIPNYLGSIWPLSYSALPWTTIDPTTLFDVSSLTANHEVVVASYILPDGVSTGITFTYNWYRARDNKLIFSYTNNWPTPGSGKWYPPNSTSVAWIGWLSENPGVSTYPQYEEIQENGDYYVVITATDGLSFSQTVYFNVVGIPPGTVARNITSSGFDWIVRVSNYFDTVDYIRAGICNEPFTNGQYDEPIGILDFNYAQSSNVGAATSGYYAGSVSTIYGFAQTADGRYWSTGSADIYARPLNWYWSYSIYSGGPVYSTVHSSGTTIAYIMPYYEWNNFTARVNAFKTYLGHSAFTFTQVSSESSCSPAIINEAVNAINASYGWQKVTPVSGENIPASVFIQMRDALNEIE